MKDFLLILMDGLLRIARATAGAAAWGFRAFYEFAAHRRLPERLAFLGGPALVSPAPRLIMGGTLFLAVVSAALASDLQLATWLLWLPLPLSLVVLLGGLLDVTAVYSGVALLGAALLAFGAIGLRLGLAFRGPLGYLAIRESVYWLDLTAVALALWITALRRPMRAHVAWIAALIVAGFVRLMLGSGPPQFRPDILPMFLSALWAMAALSAAASKSAPARRRARPAPLFQAHLLAVGFGVFLALVCARAGETAIRANPALARGGEATAQLWARSALFGWGRACLARLAQATNEPLKSALPDWMGWTGSLAVGGVTTALAAAALSVMIARLASKKSRAVSGGGVPSQLALLAAQFLLALIVVGGPNSSVPLFLLAGWLGIGLAPTRAPEPVEADAEADAGWGVVFRSACAGIALTLLAAGSFAALAPIYSASFAASIPRFIARHPERGIADPALGRSLVRARMIFPWNPDVHMIDAFRLREQLQKVPVEKWDEPLFQRACEAFRRAEDLDPIDPLITLKLVRMLALAKRWDEARKAALRAQTLVPGSETLIDALYMLASRQGKRDLAREMIARGLSINPASAQWRWRLWRDEEALGRGRQAQSALAAALTANPENPDALRAWVAENAPDGPAAPTRN